MYIQNPTIFRILAYLEPIRYIQNSVKAYSERCVTLAYWEPCHLQNFPTFRCLAYLGPEVYSKSCFYGHIQAYSGIFDNDSYNNINFLFCHICHFSTKFRKTCFLNYNNVNFNAWLSLLKGIILINDRLRVSKVSWKFRIPTIFNFAVIHPWNLLFS